MDHKNYGDVVGEIIERIVNASIIIPSYNRSVSPSIFEVSWAFHPCFKIYKNNLLFLLIYIKATLYFLVGTPLTVLAQIISNEKR